MKHTFDLTEIFKMQSDLDKAIMEPRGKNYENTFLERSLAFIVEVAEFANEARNFKYWSNKPASSREILLEEYADGIHFIVSQGIFVNAKKVYDVEETRLGKVEHTIRVFNLASNILENKNRKYIEYLIYCYLQLGILYGFNIEDVNEHYVKKNEVNYNRIKNNY